MQTLRRSCLRGSVWPSCLRGSVWPSTYNAASASSSWRFLFSAPREAEAAPPPEPTQQPATQATAHFGAEDAAAETAAEGGANSAAAKPRKGYDPLEHILVHDRKVSATRAAKLLRLKLNQEGAQRERYLKDVIWRVRTPSDARAALAVTELFTQHRAARQQLRPYKKYVSEKLIERALKAGAREVATQAIDRAGELELGVSRRMLKLTVLAASEARDLESVQKLHRAALREGSSHGYPFVRAYLDNERPDLAQRAAEDFGAHGYELGARIAVRLRDALAGRAPGDGAAAEPAAGEGSGAGSAPGEAAAFADATEASAGSSGAGASEAHAAAAGAAQSSGEPQGAAGGPGASETGPPTAASGKTEGPVAGSEGPDPPAAGAAAAPAGDAVSAASTAAADLAAASLISDPAAAAESAAAISAATGDAPENVAAVEAAVTAEPAESDSAGKAPA